MASPSCSAAVPTPDPTAGTNMTSPAAPPEMVTIASCAVTNTSGTPPASTRSSWSGTPAHWPAGTARSSAWAPPPAIPNTRAPIAGARRRRRPCPTTSPANSSPGMSGGEPGGRGVEAGPLRQVGPIEAGAVHPHEHLARAPARDRVGSRRRPGRHVTTSARISLLFRRWANRSSPWSTTTATKCCSTIDEARHAARACGGARAGDGLGVPGVPQPDRGGRRPRRPARRPRRPSPAAASSSSSPTMPRRCTCTCATSRRACDHRRWRDPGYEEWAEVMADLGERRPVR